MLLAKAIHDKLINATNQPVIRTNLYALERALNALSHASQVLPDNMMLLAEPAPENLIDAIEQALVRVHAVNPLEQHEKVTHMYSWANVAARTVQVRKLYKFFAVSITSWNCECMVFGCWNVLQSDVVI